MPCETVPDADHDRLRLDLMSIASVVASAMEDPTRFADAHAGLTAYCSETVLPHLEEDERWLLQVDECPDVRLLARAMRAEARAITAAVEELIASTTPCDTIAATRVVHALLAAHAHHQQLLVEAAHQSAKSRSAG